MIAAIVKALAAQADGAAAKKADAIRVQQGVACGHAGETG
ncbi:hypothetical protein M917_0028 [Psychrobacter aquaticus CMS 56]|uniref:Uncharacterized protein n=1 Tax=Psychrobacter aquaticus CMS 56 TaxID=1354303 RepID=U4TF64_9GAMM|nr:hypothetical protein M917_0028 [Psychrobacter aquaticus CMS 56]